ncbi:OapC/ArvC family zinc-ribbon domain-containing protein [Natronolimnohabitans innermongolicus]|uniref:Zn-ribbon containing protein (DUF2072) n=1 Tax=Natronolimnohabitans innermongolicus JCM 12255 TaxID=1227499 RepID=L9X053_9EURY|nr:Zn-ribbon containing protein [Natronolimnohabitans innermongolicus]ELY55002.1 hypothetical protein C493_11662 [Natronolimnohabitans innermongolicus JCM 12255]
MPHECTTCGRTFPDGSKEMLSGCPDCGGNKFQFAPAGRASGGSAQTSQASTATERDGADASASAASNADEESETTGTVGRAAETVRGWVSSSSDSTGNEGTETTDDSRSWPTDARDRAGEAETAQHADGDAATRQRSSGRATTDAAGQSPADSTDQSSVDASGGRSDGDRHSGGETSEFAAWPDTAKRPEDRSTAQTGAGTDADHAASTARSQSTDPVEPDRSPSGTGTETELKTEAGTEPESHPSGTESIMADSEDSAQADARSAVVQSDDLPAEAPADDVAATPNADDDVPPSDRGRVVSEPSGEQPSIEELREELNEQFESIRIVSPGQYELNLMELYNREEYIISLQEDGRYVIDVPDTWRSDEEEP